MKKVFLLVAVAIIIVALTVGAFVFWWQNKTEILPEEIKPGIEVFLPKINEEISSPLEIKGTVNGNGWFGFEGQVGTVKLLDSEGNELAVNYLKATTDWMQPFVRFETTLDFVSPNINEGTLVFNN